MGQIQQARPLLELAAQASEAAEPSWAAVSDYFEHEIALRAVHHSSFSLLHPRPVLHLRWRVPDPGWTGYL